MPFHGFPSLARRANKNVSNHPARSIAESTEGFHRGQELYVQQASRLHEPGYREFIAKHGLIVVEGFNDVIGLDNLDVPSLGILSNRITDQQVEKIARWAKQLASGKVTLMFDNDAAGVEGMKDALWQLTLRGLLVRVAWTPESHEGAFAGRQPESLETRELSSLTAGNKVAH